MRLACPVCQSPLFQQGKNLSCEQGHSFDAARQGYWNLLLAHKKRSKDPGDNPEMVRARRAFLDLGHYQPLSDRINALSTQCLEQIENPQVVDMGCGEGFYTERLEQALNAVSLESDILGIDISKHAVKAACARSKCITWAVASGAQTPVEDNSLDLQLVLFSRLMPEALAKPMKNGASLIVAWPGESHLIELRKRIYDTIRESTFNPIALLSTYFEPNHQEAVTYNFSLSSSDEIRSLLAMTPHGQRLKPEAQDTLCQVDELSLTLDVNLAVLTKRDVPLNTNE